MTTEPFIVPEPLRPAPVRVEEKVLPMGIQIRGGPWKIIPLPCESIHPELLFANEPQAERADRYLEVADNLLQNDTWNQRRIFITSPRAESAKTSTAFNLAWSLSTRIHPVLLVELNLTRPVFREMLGNPRLRYGVDCALRGIAAPKESVFSLGSEHLHVAAVRDELRARDVKRLFSSLTAFLDWAGKEYSWLVLDCPPVLSRAWGEWFEHYAHPALLTVDDQHTPRRQVRKAAQQMGMNLKGVLLNEATPNRFQA